MNNLGIRDTASVLSISINAVMRILKNSPPRNVTNLPIDKAEIKIICEVDEQGSFVANKKNQRWLWYAWEPLFKRIIAHVFGRRDTSTLQRLLDLLAPFQVAFFCTDNFTAYSILPSANHITGKLYTQRTEKKFNTENAT